MEEQKESPPSLTSKEIGGGRGDDGDVVEDGADNKQQLSPIRIIEDGDLDLQRKMEKARLNQASVFSIELVSDKTTFNVGVNFQCKSKCTEVLFIHFRRSFCSQITEPTSQERSGGDGVEVSNRRKRSPHELPIEVVDKDEDRIKMATPAEAVFSNSLVSFK